MSIRSPCLHSQPPTQNPLELKRFLVEGSLVYCFKAPFDCVSGCSSMQADRGPLKLAFGVTIISHGGNDAAAWGVARRFQQ